MKEKGGKKHWVMVERYRCQESACRRMHVALPDRLVPYKHYEGGLIEDVIDEVVTEDDIETEDYPCGRTMERWKNWFEENRAYMEGQMRSAGYRLLGFTGEFLKSSKSLLEELRRRMYRGWLKAVLSFVYNSGGRTGTGRTASPPGGWAPTLF